MDLNEDNERRSVERVRLAYCAHYDAQSLDELTSLFTDDAICHFPEEFGGDWVGRDLIRENFNNWMRAAGEPYDALHVVTNPWIQLISETKASGRWYLMQYLTRQHKGSAFRTQGGHEDPLMLIGIYEDLYSKVAGRWLIARTRMTQLWPTRKYTRPLIG